MPSARHLTALLLAATALLSCRAAGEQGAGSGQGVAPKRTLRVAAAANLRFALREIEREFELLNTDSDLELGFGASGSLYTQLTQRAPYDLFLSADADYPQRLVELGLVAEDGLFHYAEGRLAVWVPTDSPLDLDTLGIGALSDPGVRSIAIANPRLAPYGAAAVEALSSLGLYQQLEQRLVYADTASHSAQLVVSGAADAGVIALSLALAPTLKTRGRRWLVPAHSHAPIRQAGVQLRWAPQARDAEALRLFLTGPRGQRILARHGYLPVGR